MTAQIADRTFWFEQTEYTAKAHSDLSGNAIVTLWTNGEEVVVRWPNDMQGKLGILVPIGARMAVDRRYGLDLADEQMAAIENDYVAIIKATRANDEKKRKQTSEEE